MALIETYTREERAQLKEMRMQCRANRHAMRAVPAPPGWVPPHTGNWLGAKKILHKRCPNCGTWRHIALTHRFTYLTSYYDYPDGYLQDSGEGRIPPETLRRWEFEQVAAEVAAAAKPKRRLRSVG
jgi:hypothetical protein